jgi:hypothetical protein
MIDENYILKQAVKAAFRLPEYLFHEMKGGVRIPFVPYYLSLNPQIYFLIYNTEAEEIDRIECPDGSFILLN